MRTNWIDRLRISAAACLLVAGASPLFAGNFFAEELGTDEEKIAGKVKNDLMSMGSGSDSGRGPVPYLKALGAPPKRIALITFYVKDSGNSDKHPYAGWSTHKNVTASGVDMIANELYDASIAALKEGFKAHGMDLLAREEFLDTPEKKSAYESFELKFGGGGHFVNFLTHIDKDSTMLEGVAEGYRLLSVPTDNNVKGKEFGLAAKGGDGKLFQGLGHDLAGDLGVDAIAVMYSVVQDENKSIEMLGSYLYLFGPNPVKRSDNPSLYWTGHQYSGVKLKLSVPFLRKNKKETETDSDFPGFALVAKALATKTGELLEDKTRGAK
jgi:hypothetical protein